MYLNHLCYFNTLYFLRPTEVSARRPVQRKIAAVKEKVCLIYVNLLIQLWQSAAGISITLNMAITSDFLCLTNILLT